MHAQFPSLAGCPRRDEVPAVLYNADEINLLIDARCCGGKYMLAELAYRWRDEQYT
jgi:hypothetical protein